ncbi:MAG: N-acetylmuramoyl-L-alanine amidase [Paludibacteraceae bacterium]|nr:N-acetylmuramoyl-L-alanine amidase [Paludibacteraceae bacterium]
MKKIALISGHRGRGTGAVGLQIDEGAETIWLRNRIEDHLCQKYNIVPVVDCDTDNLNTVVKELRHELSKTDICIDIHFNASTAASANGAEVLIPASATSDEKKRAGELLQVVCDTLGIKSRGVKDEASGQHGKLAMLSGFDCVNMLLEVCFVSNPTDSSKYLAKREILALNIARLVSGWLS